MRWWLRLLCGIKQITLIISSMSVIILIFKWLISKLFETIMSLSAYIAAFKLERVYLVSDMIHLAGVFVCVCNNNESVSLGIRTVHKGLYVMVFLTAPPFLNVYLLTVWFYSSEKVNWI